ncbi:hypothetical protein GCK72_003723 [Caenorhabditis remanei]|uniref:Sdz-33 F-box domain-containing protein n=1 Tax=Caenorhabditis remanei TaxID=31234 RepID=A0A6A5H7R2_CAERE|nr:hypothetical protein GCK72_003723 [Caenorhabditis remanei]KAF1763778.1 hypothetical protein GCK72_003723 [Caenorhabditis remanei]
MEICDILKTATTSKYMEAIIKSLCIRVEGMKIGFNGEKTVIFLHNPSLIVCCGNNTIVLDKREKVLKKDLKPWFSETSSILENTRQVFLRICDLFQCGPFGLSIVAGGVNPTTKEILEIPEFRNFKDLNLTGIGFTKKELDDVMDFEREDQNLHIGVGKIPFTYSHPNVFKYTKVHYWDACWVRLEHLLTIKDKFKITLGLHGLPLTDINKFLKFWVNAEYDLFKYMQIYNENRQHICIKTLFDGLDVLHVYRLGQWRNLIAVKSPETRKRQILSVNWSEERTYMSAWDINERVQVMGQDDEPYAPEFEILKMLERRRALKMELDTVEEDEIRKQELTVAIDQITTGITLKGVVFRNERPTLFR